MCQFTITPIKVIETSLIDKYYTSEDALVSNTKIYRPTNELLYKSPFLVIKEGQKDKEYCSSIIDFYKGWLCVVYCF